MAHPAAAMPLRRPLLLSLKPARLLSSLAGPSPGLLHPRALRPTGPLPADAAEDTDDPDAVDGLKKSRNALKREARRAVQWGMDLAKFPPPQIKRILRAASLETEVFDALMLVKVPTAHPLVSFSSGDDDDDVVLDHGIETFVCCNPFLVSRDWGRMCGKERGGSSITSVCPLSMLLTLQPSISVWPHCCVIQSHV